MVDPIAAGAAEKVATSLEETTSTVLARLLGPSADVLGNYWARALENRLGNVHQVVDLADGRSQGDGTISLRVADGVFNAAQFADSAFVAEYLSGVLASSRSDHGADDRGVAWTSLISQLSSDQLRLHYVLYTAARNAIMENSRSQTDSEMCKVNCLVTFDDLDTAMGWSAGGGPRFREAVYGLQRQTLVGTTSHGKATFLAKSHPELSLPSAGGLIYRVRIPGLMLYLWGLGCGDEMASRLLDAAFEVAPVGFDLPFVPEASFVGHVD